MRWLFGGVITIGLLCCHVAWSSGAFSVAPQSSAYLKPTAIPFPASNPFSESKSELGRALFFDPILSVSRTLSCASCHEPSLSWGDGRARAIGEAHAPMSLRSPTLIDVAWMARLGWDGKFRDIEAVTFSPITTIANMGLSETALIERLSASPDYVARFDQVFGDPSITRSRIEKALATYERTIVSGDAPFDRWIAGEQDAIGEAAKRGFALFNGKAGCAQCHSGWAFSDGSFHDIGTATGDDTGRGRLFPTSQKLQYAFKTPTLRDVAHRAPYMHDGSVPTLEAVIDLYDRGGIGRPSRAEEIKPLALSQDEKSDLMAFLQTLSGPTTAGGAAQLSQ